VNPLILVVDDEPDVEVLFRQHFRHDLRAGRFTMEFAQSAPMALQRITDAAGVSLILILSDINMPGMSGLELLPKSRAVGYSFNSEKIFCNKDGEVTRVPIVEHVPPDVTAQIFWLKNRKPTEWRDVQQMEHVLGKYIISDKPMTEEEWIRERATVVDVTPTPIEDKT
jgi:CheY-like chemotaxis protein